MHVLAKYQLHMPKTFEISALQSSKNIKIDLYSWYWQSKLQALTNTAVTCERNLVQTRNLYHRVCHELRNGWLGKFFLPLPCITTNKGQIHEEKSIAYDCFNVT